MFIKDSKHNLLINVQQISILYAKAVDTGCNVVYRFVGSEKEYVLWHFTDRFSQIGAEALIDDIESALARGDSIYVLHDIDEVENKK